MFEDREDAGRRLAEALRQYKNTQAIVLAIPRGGVEIGYQVAKGLDVDFSLLVSRKLPFPDNPESGFGAIAEDGSVFIHREAAQGIPPAIIDAIIEYQKEEIERRIKVLRNNQPLPELGHRTVILVDDGIAMGSTMRAAIKLCRAKKVERIIVAAPVAGERVVREMQGLVEQIIILAIPRFFYAVAQVYRNWRDVSDQEVLEIMKKWREESGGKRR
ncbi:phosphoribosyltransferase [hydrothermal vent metagenome]|uniref:Phosphoribosyltransferase n=1 Tax=hydrothermal vent metagenome TaxID=652676 RepID=A0A3B0VF27_9ZZZZ